MKITPQPLHLRTTLAGFVLFTAFTTGAGAWPFVLKSTGLWENTGESRFLPIQADADRRLELFGGGNFLLQPAGNTGSAKKMPAYDYDPYHPSNTSVDFRMGHGDIGDLDGDGDLDLVRSAVLTYNGVHEGKFRIMTCINDGSGNFTRGWHWTAENFNGPKYYGFPVKLADIDRDGDLELIEAYGSVKVRWNPGDSNFSSGASTLSPADPTCRDLATGDLNNDGTTDIISAAHTGSSDVLRFYANNGNGLFTASVIQSGVAYSSLKTADLNADGLDDLLAYDTHNRRLVYFRATGSGFAAPVQIGNTYAGNFRTLPYDTGDLDEDGIVDIVVSPFDGELLWLRGTGAGEFSPPVTLRPAASSKEPTMLAIADMDRDGDNDIIFNAGYHYFENIAPHREARAVAEAWGGTSPGGPVDLEAADINGDGRTDLIAADGGGKRLLWYPAFSSGLSFPVTVGTAGTAPSSVTAADFNRDGFTDLAYVSNSTITRLYSSNGGGVGWFSGTAAIVAGTTRIQAGDMEGDGDVDILGMAPASGSLTWLKNNGDGSGYLLEGVDSGLPGLGAFAIGQEVPGGRLEISSLIPGSYGYDLRYRHDGSTWKAGAGSNVPTSGSSCAVVIGDVQDSSSGAETVSSLNTGVIRVQAAGGNVQNVITYPGTVRALALVDWNTDGYTDIAASGTAGVKLYVHARTSSWTLGATVHLLDEACTDLAALDVDGDRICDLAGVEATGGLHLMKNRSCQLGLANTAAGTSAAPLQALPGTTADAVTFSYTNRGHASVPVGFSPDAVIAPARVRVRFLKAMPAAGGGYVPGTAMTAGEITAAVSSVSLSGSTATSTSGASNGNLSLYPVSLAQVVQSVTPGQTKNLAIRLHITPHAASAPVTRFFVQHLTEGSALSSSWAVLHDGETGSVPVKSAAAVAGVVSLVEIPVQTQLELWRESHFGTSSDSGNAANDTDYDGDGVANIIEYATGTDPKAADLLANWACALALVPFTGTSEEVRVRVSLSAGALADPKLRVRIQRSGEGLSNWTTIATRNGDSAWTGATPALSVEGGRSYLTFGSGIWNPVVKKAFFRMVVEELP